MGESLAQGYTASVKELWFKQGSLTSWPGQVAIFLFISVSHQRIFIKN